MKTPSFLSADNVKRAQDMLISGVEYHQLDDDHGLVVAWDRSVWACKTNGVNLNEATMVERIV